MAGSIRVFAVSITVKENIGRYAQGCADGVRQWYTPLAPRGNNRNTLRLEPANLLSVAYPVDNGLFGGAFNNERSSGKERIGELANRSAIKLPFNLVWLQDSRKVCLNLHKSRGKDTNGRPAC